jgi:hypothetical protein
MDPLEALMHIRLLLQLAADCGDMDASERHLEKAQELIDKALPTAAPT